MKPRRGWLCVLFVLTLLLSSGSGALVGDPPQPAPATPVIAILGAMTVEVENQFQAPPTVVKARWFDIISRSIALSTRSATLASMRQLYLMAEVARLKHHADIEVRIVAIPDDWSPPKPGTFVKESMNQLADLGERMGADPTRWRTSPP
jgi:hypothetical protein